MKRSEAFKKVIDSESLFKFSYNRSSKKRWINDYGKDEFKALIELGYLIPSEPYVGLGESFYEEYYMLTKTGILWKEWYLSKKDFIKIYVFKWYDIRRFFTKIYESIRYKLTGKRPDWWEYRDINNLNEI